MDVARSRDVIARWRDLAEQRLEHLTELCETGRWRRYHSERSFLENIQEARSAVQAWRDLSADETSPGNSVADISWLGHVQPAPPRVTLHDPVDRPQPAQIAAEPPPPVVMLLETENVISDDTLSASDIPVPSLDIATMAERYPLLRNAF
jgi:uncharacterized repeat protein (TIGR03809 family)